jgi:hypothetical protein
MLFDPATRTAASDTLVESLLRPVTREMLCVTNGSVSTRPDGALAVDSPSSRAVMRSSVGQVAEIRFRYLGPTTESKPLASGELRRQIGIKLRASDTCNLLYVMWHIEPDGKIGVSVKSNPHMHTHAECHASGYTNIEASYRAPIPRVVAGSSHSLRAQLRGSDVTVFADGKRVWAGSVGERMAAIDGPVGFRTDNARFEFEYLAELSSLNLAGSEAAEPVNRCAVSPGD